MSDGILKLTIDIPYLADRVKNGFKFFYVELYGFRDVEFRAWPRVLGKEKELVKDFAIIFKPPLEILEANLKDNQFEVVCNIKSASNSDYCGGELLFRDNSAVVRDEANKEYSILELGEICKAYWNEWKLKQDKRA